MSPLELDTTLDIVLGWDWISSHDLQFLYPEGTVTGSGAIGTLAAPLLSVAPPNPDQTRVLVSHGGMRRMHLLVIPGTASTPSRGSISTPPTGKAPQLAPLGLYEATPRLETSGVAAIAQLGASDAADAQRATPFATGSERLADGTELHLASLRFVDTSITLAGTDHHAFAALKEEFADVLGGPSRGLSPDRGVELTLETGGRPMPQAHFSGRVG